MEVHYYTAKKFGRRKWQNGGVEIEDRVRLLCTDKYVEQVEERAYVQGKHVRVTNALSATRGVTCAKCLKLLIERDEGRLAALRLQYLTASTESTTGES